MDSVTTIAGQLDARGLKIAIAATRFNDFIVDRLVGGAVDYLERQGEEFLPESKSYDEKGRLAAVYLRRELSGFALHLVQKK